MASLITVAPGQYVEVSEGFCGGVCLTPRGAFLDKGVAVFMRPEIAATVAKALLKQAERA